MNGFRGSRFWQALAACLFIAMVAGPLAPLLGALFDSRSLDTLEEKRVLLVLWRSTWMALLSASLAVVIGLPLGMLASRTRALGGEVVMMLAPLPLLLPPLLIAQGWNGLTGWDGLWASVFVLGCCYAPFPVLLTARALAQETASAHESALQLGSRRLALREMVRLTRPANALGFTLAFLFSINDFAVPDYMAALNGNPFGVFPGHVFNHFRDQDYWAGARAALPLLGLGALSLWVGLWIRDRFGAELAAPTRPAPRMSLGKANLPTSLLIWGLLALILLLPLARIIFEMGSAGPAATGTWASRAEESFEAAISLGRKDLGRSLKHGVLAGLIALLLAPPLAHALVRSRGMALRGATVLLALPLLVPAVGYGMGAIAFANQPGWRSFYQGSGLVVISFAGRFLAIAVFVLAERFRSVPRSRDEAAVLAGISYGRRLQNVYLGPLRASWLLAASLVVVFAVRELDLAILLPGANQSAANRYFNALHFARDGFVAAFGLLIAFVLFLPALLYAVFTSLTRRAS